MFYPSHMMIPIYIICHWIPLLVAGEDISV